MRQRGLHIGVWTFVLVLALSGCAKEYRGTADPSFDPGQADTQTTLAVGTLRNREGAWTVRIDAATLAYVLNPETVSGLSDGTRIFLEYRLTQNAFPDFCTEAVHIQWVSALEVGERYIISFEEAYSEESFLSTDPLDIVQDWITTLEDGFLTLHYAIPSSGDKKHTFALYRSWESGNHFYLVHDAQGDRYGGQTDGIVCFPLENLFPDEAGARTLTLHYINLDNTLTTLTFDNRSPE